MVAPPQKTKYDTAYEPDPNAPGDYSVATRNVSLREAFAWVPDSRCCNLNLAPEQVAMEVTKHGCLTEPLCEAFADGITGFDGNWLRLQLTYFFPFNRDLKYVNLC